MSDRSLAIAICRACTGGSQDVNSVAIRLANVMGTVRTQWVVGLATRYAQSFGAGMASREREVLQFLLRDATWRSRIRTRSRNAKRKIVQQWPLEAPLMHPGQAAREWPVPPLETSHALADWLGLRIEELEWLADVKGLLRATPRSPLHHYHYRIVQKPSGGLRVIEAPQERLKAIQRTILSGILEKIPTYYSAAHGFVKGRSVKTFAASHVGQRAVVRVDLQDFFPTIGYARVQALFRTMGYPEAVASGLSGLCTNTTPRGVFSGAVASAAELERRQSARALYTRPHLPQGAPTSPMIANLCAFRLDCRLTGLADWAGAVYTRYADDIAISGDATFARNAARYAAQASAIALDEGWRVQHHKTRVMRAGRRQQLAGIVVNERLSIARASYDQLKATLTNCVRHGPTDQNRDGHPDFRAYVRGRVGWVTSINATQGNRLRDILDRINWPVD